MAKKKVNKKIQDSRVSNIPVKDNKEEVNDVKIAVFKQGMSVKDFADEVKVQVNNVIMKAMELGLMVNQNESLERETYELIAVDYGIELIDEVVTDLDRFDEFDIQDDEKSLVERPPVVTIMGHVDHGKTTLLDTIRSTKVTAGEAGGITQHIGAYQVEMNGRKITFIDTPGHAAFSEMRARGASVTDICILVVAADDGVMPQTKEAVEHAKAAGVPIIVAVNKMDRPGANPENVMNELASLPGTPLLPEAWGGDTIFVNISALNNQGIDELLENVLLIAEMEEFKANPNRLALGTVIEAHLDRGKGSVSTVLVQNGTMHIGDIVVCGDTFGKVRTMVDEEGRSLKTAPPSAAIEITGLDAVPKAGDKFMVMKDEKKARKISESRTHKTRENDKTTVRAKTLDELFGQIKDDNIKELNVLVRADVQGSVEALRSTLSKIDVDGVRVNILKASVGAITESDITLSRGSNAVIIGFNVRPSQAVRDVAAQYGIELRLYNIIYDIINDIEAAMKGMLDPEFEEVVIGEAEVRAIFKASKVGTIAGCYVKNGYLKRGSTLRIVRDGIELFKGDMGSLMRFKDEVKEVKTGYECGVTFEKFNDIKEGDIIECSIMQEIERK